MQVILLEKNEKLGNLGDIANVKSGYARNYLIPQGKAKPANKSNMAAFEAIRTELETKEASSLSEAQAKESAMKDIVCTISANAGEEGKLYGSVSPADISENLLSQGIEVEKRDINIPEAIRNTGEYEITVSLYAEVIVSVKVIVIASTETE
jgi:large subunit ribosomal protein L9|tara:strand:+ start:645 stop:1100 length:456 start_codon:yes stop_codon:yes gene_type:complete